MVPHRWPVVQDRAAVTKSGKATQSSAAVQGKAAQGKAAQAKASKNNVSPGGLWEPEPSPEQNRHVCRPMTHTLTLK